MLKLATEKKVLLDDSEIKALVKRLLREADKDVHSRVYRVKKLMESFNDSAISHRNIRKKTFIKQVEQYRKILGEHCIDFELDADKMVASFIAPRRQKHGNLKDKLAISKYTFYVSREKVIELAPEDETSLIMSVHVIKHAHKGDTRLEFDAPSGQYHLEKDNDNWIAATFISSEMNEVRSKYIEKEQDIHCQGWAAVS